MSYQPYTYLLSWTNHDVHYYGVRWDRSLATYSPEEDLWNRYFTSSRHVQEFRESNGEPDRIEIRRKFDSAEKARKWEERVLRSLEAKDSPRWLNKSHGSSEWYTRECSQETRKKMSKARKGQTPWNKGKTHTEESRRKMSEARKGARVWVTNGVEELFICIDQPIPKNWYKGRLPAKAETKEKMSRVRSGKKKSKTARERMKKSWTKERKEKMRNFQSERCWITDGTNTKQWLKSDPIPDNWRKGRAMRRDDLGQFNGG